MVDLRKVWSYIIGVRGHIFLAFAVIRCLLGQTQILQAETRAIVVIENEELEVVVRLVKLLDNGLDHLIWITILHGLG